MKDARLNFKLIAIMLSVATVICLVLSKLVKGEEIAGVFRIAGLIFLSTTIIQVVIFGLYPALYKNKRQVK